MIQKRPTDFTDVNTTVVIVLLSFTAGMRVEAVIFFQGFSFFVPMLFFQVFQYLLTDLITVIVVIRIVMRNHVFAVVNNRNRPMFVAMDGYQH